MINTTTFKDANMRAAFVRMNGIKSAFVWKEGERHYQVLEGDAQALTGFLAGEFTTRREAIALRDKINALLSA